MERPMEVVSYQEPVHTSCPAQLEHDVLPPQKDEQKEKRSGSGSGSGELPAIQSYHDFRGYEQIHRRSLAYVLKYLLNQYNVEYVEYQAFFIAAGIVREYSLYYKNMGYVKSFEEKEFTRHCITVAMVAIEIARKHIDDFHSDTNLHDVCKLTTDTNFIAFEKFIVHTVLDYAKPESLSIVAWAKELLITVLSLGKFKGSRKKTYVNKIIPQLELTVTELVRYRESSLEKPCVVAYLMVVERLKYDLRTMNSHNAHIKKGVHISDYITSVDTNGEIAQQVISALTDRFGRIPLDKRALTLQAEIRRSFQVKLLFDFPMDPYMKRAGVLEPTRWLIPKNSKSSLFGY